MGKLATLHDAVAALIRDGDCVYAAGFTHLIPFAAGHEIIRQKRRELTLVRLTPDLIYDQMIAAGCAQKVIFSWAGNPGVGPLHAFRRAVEQSIPRPLAFEEYSHFGMVLRLQAGASRLPFLPTRNYVGSDLPGVNPNIRPIDCPYTGEKLFAVPALHPDLAIVHAQRADDEGNTQIWGLPGVQKEAAFAARRVMVVVEEIVPREVVHRDPNRTLIPGFIVSAVVEEPLGAHPSYVQGYYDRDNAFYFEYDEISRDQARLEAYLDEWVYGVANRREYRAKLGERAEALKAHRALCEPVNYGF